MRSSTLQSLISFITWFYICQRCGVTAFTPPTHICNSPHHTIINKYSQQIHHRRHHDFATSRIKAGDGGDNLNGESSFNNSRENSGQRIDNDLGLDIVRGSDGDISDDRLGDIEGGAPSKLMVMKDLLGINIFTYILAALIIFFISMNIFVGPGWLGQTLGWEDVGTFTKTSSDALPLNVDVSAKEYLL